MLVAGIGLDVALVGISISVMTGATEEEAGILSGLNTTGHEIGGSLGIAVLATVATGSLDATAGPGAASALAGGIGDAFLVASGLRCRDCARACGPPRREQLPAQAASRPARRGPLMAPA
jgi:hypothetical protein